MTYLMIRCQNYIGKYFNTLILHVLTMNVTMPTLLLLSFEICYAVIICMKFVTSMLFQNLELSHCIYVSLMGQFYNHIILASVYAHSHLFIATYMEM